MARGYAHGGWATYVPVAERRKKAEREMEKLRRKGHPVAPVKIEGRAIATTFWGQAWCENLESYRDYENRLPRGRTYVRNGSVVDLQISPLEIKAMVSGSSIHKVSIAIRAVPQAQWQSICRDCAGGIDSLVELLQGRFSKGVMERLCRQDKGLFPKPSEIRFSCSCPDSASMCKHIAAVLYGVGARLDQKPELLFRLRAVSENDLVADLDQALPFSTRPPAAGKVLEAEDVSALFGLDMAGGVGGIEADGAVPAAAKPAAPAKQSRPGGKSAAQKMVAARPAPANPETAAVSAPSPAVGNAAPARRTSRSRKATENTEATGTVGPVQPPPVASDPTKPMTGSKGSKVSRRALSR
jgi:uncharacterized Zn finger protein